MGFGEFEEMGRVNLKMGLFELEEEKGRGLEMERFVAVAAIVDELRKQRRNVMD